MKSRILLVDDEPDVVSTLRIVLESRGYSVSSATSAASAKLILSKQAFDLLITDMKMESDTAGYEVIREANRAEHPPAILILTAYPILGRHWRDAGAHALLPKPTQTPELLNAVTELLRLHLSHK